MAREEKLNTTNLTIRMTVTKVRVQWFNSDLQTKPFIIKLKPFLNCKPIDLGNDVDYYKWVFKNIISINEINLTNLSIINLQLLLLFDKKSLKTCY